MPNPGRRTRNSGSSWLRAILIVCACGLARSQAAVPVDSPRERLDFDQGWKFQKGDPHDFEHILDYRTISQWVIPTGPEFATGADGPGLRPEGNLGADFPCTKNGFDDGAWRQLDLPHDWGIEGPFKQEYPGSTGKLPWPGIGWYRKHFFAPADDAGKRVYLDIDGAMAYALVWLNGRFVGGWPYGYTSFRLDLTPYLRPGQDNVVAIRLDNPPESSRWYPGGGIYRNVWLVKTSRVHVAHWGTFVTTPRVAADGAWVSVNALIDNDGDDDADVTVATELYALDARGRKTGAPVASGEVRGVKALAGRQASANLGLLVAAPKLWSLDQPNLYAAVTTVRRGDSDLDRYETPFGIRTIAFDPDRGFLLNGRRVIIQGVCDHHDLGALGTAVNVRALERQVELLREMGCNAIRTSHNPPAPELLDICDRLGVLVMDESTDCWLIGKNPNDYHRLFSDWHERDLRALIRRDRNHPCVILWSVGNEIPEQWQPEGWKLSARLAGIVREEDRTRPVTAACNDPDAGYNGFQNTFDVFGYNYAPGKDPDGAALYLQFHRRNPAIPLFGSETGSTISSRGEYFFPVSDDQGRGEANFQVSSYDLTAPPWATTADREFAAEDRAPFVAGQFVWTGFDYLGEPTPYGDDVAGAPSRSSYFGILDLAGFKKDRFFEYQAHWRPNFPMAHILPHWTWPERVGLITPVHVYTSGDEAELFLNGRSLGRKKKEPLHYRLRWDDVRYEPGTLTVVAYKNGQPWAQDTVKTAGAAAKLRLSVDRREIQADGRDLAYVTATITDRDGVMAPRAKNHVRFSISGPGTIAAVDNGDATSFEPFQATGHDAFNGLCLAIVRSQAGGSGSITLRAESDGLEPATIALRSD